MILPWQENEMEKACMYLTLLKLIYSELTDLARVKKSPQYSFYMVNDFLMVRSFMPLYQSVQRLITMTI